MDLPAALTSTVVASSHVDGGATDLVGERFVYLAHVMRFGHN
jgi:hypothetical protein